MRWWLFDNDGSAGESNALAQAFTMTTNGSNSIASSVIQRHRTPLSTTLFVSPTELTAQTLADLISIFLSGDRQRQRLQSFARWPYFHVPAVYLRHGGVPLARVDGSDHDFGRIDQCPSQRGYPDRGKRT